MSSRRQTIIDFDPNTSTRGRTKIAFPGASIRIVNGHAWHCYGYEDYFRPEDLKMNIVNKLEPTILRNYHEGGFNTTLFFEELDGEGNIIREISVQVRV